MGYRNTNNQITFDNRKLFYQPYFIAIDELWETINIRNGKVPVQQGPYIFDIPYFNQEVIREAINNAVAHRDYIRLSEVVIKLYPQAMTIINPGGFPIGVNLANLLTISSTPRNRLFAEVLVKTGIVERSGQGVDKIFYQSVAEAKGLPDYSYSDDFQVELRLSAIVKDKAFALFIKQLQNGRKDDEKLSVKEILTLEAVREGKNKSELDKATVEKLVAEDLVERVGNTRNQRLILSKAYYVSTGKESNYLQEKSLEVYQIDMLVAQYFGEFQRAKMGDFTLLLSKFLTREQVRYKIEQMVKGGMLERSGSGSGTYYTKGRKMEEQARVVQRVAELGIEEMKRLGEWK